MSEIEKMYENAGIEQIEGQEWVCKNPYHCTYQNLSIVPENCSRCKSFQIEMIYPSFTAEKQLEITKFLLKKAVYYDVKDDKYWFYYEECESAGYKPFNEAIAHFINKLWTDMSEAEKQKIKEILE